MPHKKGSVDSHLCVIHQYALELMCRICKSQQRWVGRSKASVSNFAWGEGWRFNEITALCPKHNQRSLV